MQTVLQFKSSFMLNSETSVKLED